jgi:hypothetical protein
MCCFFFLMYCQFEGWCYEYQFMQSIWTQGSILQCVTLDLGSYESLLLFWGFMWSKVIENSRKASGFKRKIGVM